MTIYNYQVFTAVACVLHMVGCDTPWHTVSEGRKMKKSKINRSRALTLATLALAVYGMPVDPAKADSLSVFVGYADNLRASGFFPTPWLTDPNVVSQTPDGQSLDTGVIRVDNTGATPITISNFHVTLANAGVISIWSPLTIGAGQTGLFLQTGSYNFDSSDSGIFGGLPPNDIAPNNYLGNGNTSLIGGCSSAPSLLSPSELTACNAAIPVVAFDENGTPMSFSDTGHVLDTGGWDFANNGVFGEDGNESINWNPIGQIATRSGEVPEPATLVLISVGLLGLAAIRRRSVPV